MKRFIVVIAFLAILAFTAGPLMADKGGKGGGKGRRGHGHHHHRPRWGFGGMWGNPYYGPPMIPFGGYGPMYPAPIMPYGPYGNGGGFYGGNGGGFFFNF